MGNARETALENFQKLITMHGESTALIKSHSTLLQGHRAKLLEFEESLALLKRRMDDHNEAMQAFEERQAELQESHQRALDKLDAILELLQSVRDHQTSRPPFRAPPIASGGKGSEAGYPIRLDDFIANAQAQPVATPPLSWTASMPAASSQQDALVMHLPEALRMLTHRR